jgi:polyhydroxybutyrate depolymerase
MNRPGRFRESHSTPAWRIVAAAALLAIAIEPAAAWADLAPGLHTGLQLPHQGIVRTYDELIPASYDGSTLVPLVIDLHPSFETAAFQRSVSGFAELAEANGFVVVWPQAVGSTRSWSAGGRICGTSADDVGFIRVLVATVRAENRIDPSRIYVTGISCGGAMTHRLACEASDLFAAAAPFGSPGPLIPCAPARAIPILLTHSRDDTWVPYAGGLLGGCPQCGSFPGVVSQFEAWGDRNGCTGSSPDVTETPGTSSVCELYSTCNDGAQVGLCSVDSTFVHPTCTTTIPGTSLPCSLWDHHVSYAPYVLDGFSPQQRAWDFLFGFSQLFGTQTRTQVKCIVNVNKGVAKVARTRAKHNEKCLNGAGQGGDFDACLEADPKNQVTRAQQDLQELERTKCLATEPPELALGADRLSGSPAASALPVRLVRDLLGDPATAAPTSDKKAAKCQTQVLKQADKLFDVIWDEIRAAKTVALEGRGTDAVVSDGQLSAYIEQALATSRSVAKTTDNLYKRVQGACEPVDNLAAIPGCAVGSASAVADCANRAARCRACQLLLEADAGLSVDCEGFDDGAADLSCQP